MLTCVVTREGNGLLTCSAHVLIRSYDWSNQLRFGSTLFLEVAYYSPGHALWEPLLEPVEVEHSGIGSHRPWELVCEVNSREFARARERFAFKDVSLRRRFSFIPLYPL